jgi:hypothetical protein
MQPLIERSVAALGGGNIADRPTYRSNILEARRHALRAPVNGRVASPMLVANDWRKFEIASRCNPLPPWLRLVAGAGSLTRQRRSIARLRQRGPGEERTSKPKSWRNIAHTPGARCLTSALPYTPVSEGMRYLVFDTLRLQRRPSQIHKRRHPARRSRLPRAVDEFRRLQTPIPSKSNVIREAVMQALKRAKVKGKC